MASFPTCLGSMIHSATARDMLDTSVRALPTSLGNPTDGTDLPTISSAAVRGGDICQYTHSMKEVESKIRARLEWGLSQYRMFATLEVLKRAAKLQKCQCQRNNKRYSLSLATPSTFLLRSARTLCITVSLANRRLSAISPELFPRWQHHKPRSKA